MSIIIFHCCRYVCPELKILFHFSVFFYNSTDKLIISDVDGTITKSDIKVTQSNMNNFNMVLHVLSQGHVLPKLGISAHHTGVVELFHKLYQSGYKIIYLTARSDHQLTWTMVAAQQNLHFYMLMKTEWPKFTLGRVRWMMGPKIICLTLYKRYYLIKSLQQN